MLGSGSCSENPTLPPPAGTEAISSDHVAVREKPIVVRVKRKLSQTRPDTFWLEINERPVKKAMLDLSNLSISEPSSSLPSTKASEVPTCVKKLLVQHIETVHNFEAVEDVLHTLLVADSNSKETKSKTKEWNDRIKQNRIQAQLQSSARRWHEDLGKSARFAQIWRSRKGEKNEADKSLREICHLYDAVQVEDPDGEKHLAESRNISFEEGAVLCNFLPLIREYLPSAAEEIESDIISLTPSEDSDVYDIYTVKEVDDINMQDTSITSYPRLQVDDNDDDECYGDDYPYDTDDSNAEGNPLFDYPEESEDEADCSDDDPFGDQEDSDSDYEK